MATGSQKVKTPSGWNATQGAWVKTGPTTWKDVEQIYIKTPSGWNNASGQESVQQPYPYIANQQEPNIRNAQTPYPYIANQQEPNIRNAQAPYPYIANAQEPNIRNQQQPSIYQHPANQQEPNIRNAQEPNIVNGQEPNIRNQQQPSTYDHRSPFTYRDPRTYQNPSTYDHRSPFTYDHRSPSTYDHRSPFTYDHRSPFTYDHRSPFTYQHRSPYTYNYGSPFTYNHRSPFTYQVRQPNNARTSAQNPFTFQAREPNNARTSARTPFTYQSREPNSARQPTSSRSPVTYSYRNPFTIPGGGGGCFAAGSLVWLADGSHAPIEHCMEGQRIMSWNESTKVIEPKEISLMMKPRTCPIYDVVLSDGRVLQITDGHPIMLSNQEWGAIDVEQCVRDHSWLEGLNSHEFKVGDSLMTMTDAIMFDRQNEVGLDIVEIKENSVMTVYNISGVSTNHTYFVNGMLVHNGGNNQKR